MLRAVDELMVATVKLAKEYKLDIGSAGRVDPLKFAGCRNSCVIKRAEEEIRK
jgi:hypothetical protein